MHAQFCINGIAVTAQFDEESVRCVLQPLVDALLELAKEKRRRILVLLAAPPAAGKSTLAAFLQHLSGGRVQALGMDGFHRHQEEILRSTVQRGGQCIPMVRVKGAPESFDVQKLHRALAALKGGERPRFPIYDRKLHDVVEDAQEITGEVLLIEGNWLLLDEPVWRDLPRDHSIFVEVEERILHERVLARRLATGRSPQEAQTLYAECDGPNISLCMEKHTTPDLLLRMTGDGRYEIRSGG